MCFSAFSVVETTYADSWSDMAQPCDMDLWVMKWRSAWPIFHSPLILPYILRTIWCMYIKLCEYELVWPDVRPQNYVHHCDLYFMVQWFCLISWRRMNIIIWDYESVWPEVWPQNKYRSLWPIFHGRVILHYILKTIWCMNIILWDYGSVWPDIWPKNKCRSIWPIFHGPVILPCIWKTIWCMNIILWFYGPVWPEVWPKNKCGSIWPK